MTIEIVQIESPDDFKFDQAIRIYTRNLAPYLRQPPRVLRRILTKVASGSYGDQKYHMFLAKKECKPAGMMTCNYFPDVNVGFAGYLVVAKAYRGQGVGTALYRNGCSTINADACARAGNQADALVYETDKLNVEDVEEMEEGVKRLNFFKAMGGYIMSGVDYYQPPLHKNDPPTGLYLMVHPFSQSLLSDLRPDWARAVIRSIFQHVYRIETPLTESETERHVSNIVSSIQPASLRLVEVDVGQIVPEAR